MIINLFPARNAAPIIIFLGISIMMIGGITLSFTKIVQPLLIVLVLGVLGIKNYNIVDIFRDIAFCMVPIFIIYIGYWVGSNKCIFSYVISSFIYIGTIFSTAHILQFIINPSLIFSDFNAIRSATVGFQELQIISLVILIFSKKYGLQYILPNYIPPRFLVVVITISLLLSLSRTNLLVFIILSATLAGYLDKFNYKIIFGLFLITLGYFFINYITPSDEEGTFRAKLLGSISEVALSNYSDLEEINKNWRGYEAYRALQSYLNGNWLEIIFGQGFGSLIDLDLSIVLGGSSESEVEFSYVPIIHNGYYYLLFKTGILGLMCYLFFYLGLIKFFLRNKKFEFINRLLFGCLLCIILVMYIVGGIPQMHNLDFLMVTSIMYSMMRNINLK